MTMRRPSKMPVRGGSRSRYSMAKPYLTTPLLAAAQMSISSCTGMCPTRVPITSWLRSGCMATPRHDTARGSPLLLSQRSCGIVLLETQKRPGVKKKTDVPQGTLALMVLKTLDVLGPQHGYGLAKRIEQISGDSLTLNTGTLYPLLLRLEQEG